MSIIDISLKAMVLVACLLFAGGAYSFALILLKVPSSKTTAAIRAIGPRNRPAPDGISQMYNNAALFLSKLLPMSEIRQKKLEANLKIAHISMSPQLYEARAIVKAGAYTLLGIPVYILGALVAEKKGSTYVGVTIFVMIMVMMLMFIITVAPVFLTKMTLNNYANELCREAEIAGRVGSETTARLERLNEASGLAPTVVWSKNGKIQIGDTFTVTVSTQVDMSFFVFAGNPVTISSSANGISEVFWKNA